MSRSLSSRRGVRGGSSFGSTRNAVSMPISCNERQVAQQRVLLHPPLDRRPGQDVGLVLDDLFLLQGRRHLVDEPGVRRRQSPPRYPGAAVEDDQVPRPLPRRVEVLLRVLEGGGVEVRHRGDLLRGGVVEEGRQQLVPRPDDEDARLADDADHQPRLVVQRELVLVVPQLRVHDDVRPIIDVGDDKSVGSALDQLALRAVRLALVDGDQLARGDGGVVVGRLRLVDVLEARR